MEGFPKFRWFMVCSWFMVHGSWFFQDEVLPQGLGLSFFEREYDISVEKIRFLDTNN